MNDQFQQALQLLKQKKNEILQGAMQMGKGYMSTPESGQPQDFAFQAGQGLQMMPPSTGIGAGDDILRMAMPLIGGITKASPEFSELLNSRKNLMKMIERGKIQGTNTQSLENAFKLLIKRMSKTK